MANVKLSANELELVTNTDFILTKNNIVAKVYELFGELSNYYRNEIKNYDLPVEITNIYPKISRGENYEGLPWVMLDYPRYFSGEDFFAIRTFFLWGNFCSITLQLKGKYKNKLQDASFKLQDDWFICINENEWQHHFREDNYQTFSSFSKQQIAQLPFVKLAKKIPLHEWNNIENFLQKNFIELLNLVSQPVK
jgi:hypothetical protein